MKTASPHDDVAINSISALKIRIELLPKFIEKDEDSLPNLLSPIRDAVEVVWARIIQAVTADQEAFIHEYTPVFSKHFPEKQPPIPWNQVSCYLPPCVNSILYQSLLLPGVPLIQESNGSLCNFARYQEKFGNMEGFSTNPKFTEELIQHAETLLKVAEAYRPYKSNAKAA